jgi:molybdate transport system substrate-binding protein
MRVAAAIAGVAAMIVANVPASRAEDKVIVFAAASLKNALDDVNAAWKTDTGKEASISYGASSSLAKQIEGGAPADIFVSADLTWMNYLSDKKLTKPDTELQLLGNTLVLVAPADSRAEIEIAPNFDLAGLVGEGKLALCDVKVPAGKYGKASLEALGVWPSVEGKIAQAENVRAALKFVSTGEAMAGIVYRTDANAEPQVKVLGTFPEDTHPPIVYPVGLTAASTNPDAAAFLKYMQTARAKGLFEAQGFAFLAPVASN